MMRSSHASAPDKRRWRHRLLALPAAIGLLIASVMPAAAAEGSFEASSSANGISISLLGDEVLRIADADTTISSAPLADASAQGVSLAEGSSASASVASRGASAADKGNCAIPDIPEPAGAFLTLDGACASAVVEIPAGLPTADADATLASLSVDADAVAEALAGLVLTPLNDTLAEGYAAVTDGVLQPVVNQLEELCAGADLPDELPTDDLLGMLPVDPVTDQLPEDDPCAVLIKMLSNPPVLDTAPETLEEIQAAVLAALGDIDLAQITASSRSDGVTDAATASSTAEFGLLELTGPSLDFAGPLVDEILRVAIETYRQAVADVLSPLGADAPEVPELQPLIDVLEQTLPLDILDDPAPVIELEVLGSEATATVDLATGEVTTDGSAGLVTARISPTLATFLGVERETTIEAGQSVTLLEGTPLASTVSVGEVTTEGDRVTAVGASIALAEGVEGGLELTLGEVTATAAAEAGAAPGPAPDTDLPATGGGLALLGLLTAAGSVALRRR